jgi:alpha-glucosidase
MAPVAWWQSGVIYQIYPRSFADSNGDGVGDLRGIQEHLDYLNDGTEGSLGVTAIWLSPFYRSPMADFGYDISDYTDVDPLFGTLGDFDNLLKSAHDRSIKVIVDWVPNHTSDRHPWFIESASSRVSPKRNWYVWRDPAPDGGPPNNWQSTFAAVGPAWTFHEPTGQYYLHSFTPQQPDLNWDNPEVEAAMHDVLRFWLNRGVDGFRIDVIYKIAKDPELRDNEPGVRHDEDWPTIHDRLRGIRRVIDEYDDRMIAGEVYLMDLHRVVEYINTGDQLNLAHNFVFFHLPWQAGAFRTSVEDFVNLADLAAWPAWFLENHDHSRVPTRYAGAPGSGERRARTAAMMICLLRGTTFLYYGQELGLPDAEIPPDRVVDVDGRDPERAPMPWRRPSEAGPGAGFTTGEPWLPVVADAERLCVEAQQPDPASTLSFVRRLIWLRSGEPALQSGTQGMVDAAPEVFCFERELEQRFLVALNFTSQSAPVSLRDDPGGPAVLELSTDPGRDRGPVDPMALVLGPDEGVILRFVRE